MYTIYKYTNTVNGKVYIGQTIKSLSKRAGKNGINYLPCTRFYKAIQKYSWESFVPEVLCEVQTHEEANTMEQYYISYYDSTNPKFGYNTSLGGDSNPMLGRKHSEDSIAKMRACKLGANNPMYGRKWTDTQREKCSTKGEHINMSESQREMLRERMIKLGHMNAKQVKCEEDNIVFDSLMTAAAFYHVAIGTLSGHLHNYQKSCAGKHFSFID